MNDDLEELRRQLRLHLNYLNEIRIDSFSSQPQLEEFRTARPAAHPEARPAQLAADTQQSAPLQTSLFGETSPGQTVVAPAGKPRETLHEIRTDIGDCQRCKLSHHRTNIVFGEGNPHADLVFVGEGPGAEEDATGRPFVGRAGQLLTKIIESIDLRREDVYICNIVKCRPPENRAPERDEIASCEDFLFRQIAAIQPRLIVALGAYGAQTLLRTKTPISQLRGKFHDYRGTNLLATFHPAYLLRDPNRKRDTWEDMKMARSFLATRTAD